MSGADASLDTVQNLRQSLTQDQIELLDEIWQEFLRTGLPVPRRSVHLAFGGPARVQGLAAKLGQRLIVVALGPGQSPKSYLPTLLGVLVASDGEELEDFLVHFLQVLKDRLSAGSTMRTFPSEELLGYDWFERMPIQTVPRLMALPENSIGWGGSSSEKRWEITLPEDIDDLVDVGDLGAYVRRSAAHYWDAPPANDIAATELASSTSTLAAMSRWTELLHPSIRSHALPQYEAGHWRDAVLNAIVAVFDLVRHRTGRDLDGEPLVTQTFGLEKPLLVVADIATKSGQNDQVGFMMIMQGVYKGIRNPKAHSLSHDLTALKAAQYLVLASLLARRVEEAEPRVK